MKKVLTGVALLAMPFILNAQEISKEELNEFHQQFEQDPNSTLRQNMIIGETDLKKPALNHELQSQIDHFFKYKVDVKGITNQKSSGRCWMFTSFNVLRPAVMKKYNLDSFDFSQNYLFFYDQLEKANLFLENIIRTAKADMDDREVVTYFKDPVADGGVWNLFYNVAKKYGFVPKEVMPETVHSNSTSTMNRLLNERLRKGGYDLREMAAKGSKEKDLREAKKGIMKDVYNLLSYTLGEPPTQFTWRFKDKTGKLQTVKSTPLDFYKANVPYDYNPEEYVMIMNDPTRPYYQVYEIANYRNTIEGINWKYLNLPNDDLKASAVASIKANVPMYSSCDVGKQFNRTTGILDPAMYDYKTLTGVDFSMDKKARILTRQSGSAHAMLIMAVDTDDNDKPLKWEFENSWGPDFGNKGYLTFTDKWFDEYMFRVVIRKEFLSKKAVKALDKKPIALPVWDYMF